MKKITPSPTASRRATLLALPALFGTAAFGLAQQAAAQVPEPVFGTPGKDSGWIPTPAGMVEAMLEMAGITAADIVVDLGSGDGRIPILAAKRYGARGLGIEYNPDLVKYSISVAEREGLADRVKFIHGDIFVTDFSHATVVTLFMPPAFNLKVRPQLLAMKPGTRVVSFNFDMGDWPPDQSVYVNDQRGMLWRVPTSVAGLWRLNFTDAGANRDTPPHVLRVSQRFQQIEGDITIASERLALWDIRFEVDRLRFTVLRNIAGRLQRVDFDCRRVGATLEGIMQASGEPARRWTAAL